MTKFPVDGTGRISSEREHPTAALTGPAGGDLTGSFPNPTITTVNGHSAASVVSGAPGSPANMQLAPSGAGKAGRTAVVHEAPLNVLDFGAVCDSDLAGGGTDNHAAFAAAIAAMPVQPEYNGDPGPYYRGGELLIPYVGPGYRLASTLNLTGQMKLHGESGGGPFGGSLLMFDAGVPGINAASPGVVTLEDLVVESLSSGAGSDHGLFTNTQTVIRNTTFHNFGGDGIHISTDAGGNANLWHIDEYSGAQTCWGNGLYISGGDTNQGRCVGGSFVNNRLWQVFDHSFLGNQYFGTHVAGSFRTDLFGTYPVATTLNGAINATDATIVVTSGAALASIDALSAGYIVVDSEWISYAYITGNTLNGCLRGRRGTTAASHLTLANVTQGYGGFWDRTSSNQFSAYSGCYKEDDSPSLLNNPSGIFGGILGFGTDGDARAYGANANGETVNARGAIWRQYGSAAPLSGSYFQGAIVWDSAPTAGGTIGWVCTTAGTPGTWKTFGAIAA